MKRFLRRDYVGVLMAGLVVGVLFTLAVNYAQEQMLRRSAEHTTLTFVEAEYQQDKETLVRLSTTGMRYDIEQGTFPDIRADVEKFGQPLLLSLCTSGESIYGTAYIPLYPAQGSLFFEYVDLRREDGRWLVSRLGRGK